MSNVVDCKCYRCDTNIFRGTAWRTAPIVYRPWCQDCAEKVIGKTWSEQLNDKYADINLNGYQWPWSERKTA